MRKSSARQNNLNATDKQALKDSARQAVVQTFSRLQTHWKKGRWLGSGNYYRNDVVARVGSTRGALKHKQLIDYIGASTLGHCFDGWSYLGRAIEAELVGQPGSARHLGYYAELRAAMSLLASEGIGVFNNEHVAVDANGNCLIVGKRLGTHKFVWNALDVWFGTKKCHDLLFHVIRPNGSPLSDWIDQFGGSAMFATRDWLQRWGLDLKRLSHDRESRNAASYRPASLGGTLPERIEQTLQAVDEIWALCEPGRTGGFPVMDQHLLRQTLVQLVDKGGDGLARPSGRTLQMYEHRIDRMIQKLGIGGAAQMLGRFLKFDTSQKSSMVLVDANGNLSANEIGHSKQVLARAVLLLRLATGSVSQLLNESNICFHDQLRFWWNEDSVRGRLWSKDAPPNAFSDLWSDVEDGLQSVGQWLNSPSKEASHWGLWHGVEGRGAWMLATTERAFLWGVS